MDPGENSKTPPDGLAPFPPEEGKPSEYWDENLPSRLFATGRYPVASLNVYSKLDHLTFIHHYLKDSPVMDQIRNTCFGKLFDIPSPRCPYVVHKLCPQASQPRGLGSYTWKCITDVYKNVRGGDCGPLAVKYMEMHAAGDPEPHMAGLTDEIVTQFRKQYTIDLYKELIMPLYL